MPMSSPFQNPDAAAKLLADMADLNARVAVFDADARVVPRRNGDARVRRRLTPSRLHREVGFRS